jgi:hypothetical protein
MAKRRREEQGEQEGHGPSEEEERAATLEYVLQELKDELYIELAEGFHTMPEAS